MRHLADGLWFFFHLCAHTPGFVELVKRACDKAVVDEVRGPGGPAGALARDRTAGVRNSMVSAIEAVQVGAMRC